MAKKKQTSKREQQVQQRDNKNAKAAKKGGGSHNHHDEKDGNSHPSSSSRSASPSSMGLAVASLVGVGAVIVAFSNHSIMMTGDSSGSTNSSDTESLECGIWIAESTIPNAGLGMFAGRRYDRLDVLGMDQVIPIIDLSHHQGSGWPFLWYSYTWGPDGPVAEEAHDVQVTLHGFGSTANAHMDLNNVIMGPTTWDGSYKGYAAGASSPYHQVMSALEEVQDGQELFMNYGDNWFVQRTWHMGPIPLQGDVGRANSLLQKGDQLRTKHSFSSTLLQDFWERFVWENPYNSSRILHAFPKNWTLLEGAMKSNLKTQLQRASTRSHDWLDQHGVCADHIKPAPSTLSGRGAFASRYLPKGTIVATIPLIHIPHRGRMGMNHGQQHQLLVNYCYGHRQSTLLLCSYGPGTSFVNHGKPNVRLVWGSSRSVSHHPEWLELSIDGLMQHQRAGLAFELVALRDIAQDEEILLDYGAEWEAAWQKHVETYRPLANQRHSRRPYSNEIHAPNAFRHDIRIPDAIFPLAWKNM